MIEKVYFIQRVLKALSQKWHKSYEKFQPIATILIDNFYDDQDSLAGVQSKDLVKINVPQRIAQGIIQYYKDYIKQKPYIQQQKIQEARNAINQSSRVKKEHCQQQVQQYVQTFFEQLGNFYHNNKINQIQIVQTLLTILKNIYNSPQQVKFRTLKKSNKKIGYLFCEHVCCFNFFMSLGFQDESQYIYLLKPDLNIISFAIIYLQDFLCRNDSNKMQIERPSIQFSNQKQNKQSEDQMLKTLDQLKNFIQNAQREPLKDRKINLYMKNAQSKYSYQHKSKPAKYTNQFYFNQIPEDLLNKWIKFASFNHQRVTQFIYFLQTEIYQQTLIKVVFPNQVVMQSYYRVKQSLQNVLQTVSQFAIGDLYLYQTPPKKVFKNLSLSLQQLECVPMATIYLGSQFQIHMQTNINVNR